MNVFTTMMLAVLSAAVPAAAGNAVQIRVFREPDAVTLNEMRRSAEQKNQRLEIAPDARTAVVLPARWNPLPCAPRSSRAAGLATTPAWQSSEEYAVGGLRWYDVDGDGDLDLISAHYEGGFPARPEETRIWYNDGGMLAATSGWQSTDTEWSTDLVLGDVDADGDVDLAVINGWTASNKIHFNSAGILETTPSWSSSQTLFSLSGVFANVDEASNRYLDLAVTNQPVYPDPGQPNHLYLNSTGTPPSSAGWTSSDIAANMAGALGDYDEDNVWEDVFIFSGDGSTRLFSLPAVNIHRVKSVTVGWELVTDYTIHLRDGWIVFADPPDAGPDNIYVTVELSDDMDFAVAVDHGNAKVYHDTGSTLESTPSVTVSGTGDRREKGVAWVDLDGDEDLDLFVGGRDVPMLLYENVAGTLSTTSSWSSADTSPDCSELDFIDIDMDGDLDLATANGSSTPILRVFENIDGTLETSPGWGIEWSAVGSMANSVAWGDMNGDGYPDLAAGFAGSNIRVYLNLTGSAGTPTPTVPPSVTPTATATVPPTATPTVTPTGIPLECPQGAAISQPAHTPAGAWDAYTSDYGRGDYAYDTISLPGTLITSVRWWGFDVEVFGALIEECDMAPEFGIELVADDGGAPGDPLASRWVTAVKTATNHRYLGAELWQYDAVLADPIPAATGWISIRALHDPEHPDCYFVWLSGRDGDGFGYIRDGGVLTPVSTDFSICVTGDPYTPAPTPSVTPDPSATPTPECLKLGVELWMPAVMFHPGDDCACRVDICNPDSESHGSHPLFVILDVYGSYFFAPGFTPSADYYDLDVSPGRQSIQVLPAFTWPDTGTSAGGIMFYAAMTDAAVTRLFGGMSDWTFGWSD